jgi:hypothetical protein
MWYIYTREYYLVIKKNEIMLFAGKWMELEIIMLNEMSQTEKINITYSLSYAFIKMNDKNGNQVLFQSEYQQEVAGQKKTVKGYA